MSVTKDTLRTEINALLKSADLNTTSAKKVRLQLEAKFQCSFTARKKEIDDLVMDFVNSQEDDSESEASSEEDTQSLNKRAAKNQISSPAKKKKKNSSSEEDSEVDSDKDTKRKSRTAAKRKTTKTKKTKTGESGGTAKVTAFTRPLTLSPALAALMGADALPRHAVVKKVWAIIKERNLYDPKNKQYAVCDDELQKIMGVKRFRTFGMLKYLKTHFTD